MTFQRIYTALALTMLLAAWTLIITASLAHAKSGRAHDISNPSFQKCMRMARHASTCRRLWGKRSELPARRDHCCFVGAGLVRVPFPGWQKLGYGSHLRG